MNHRDAEEGEAGLPDDESVLDVSGLSRPAVIAPSPRAALPVTPVPVLEKDVAADLPAAATPSTNAKLGVWEREVPLLWLDESDDEADFQPGDPRARHLLTINTSHGIARLDGEPLLHREGREDIVDSDDEASVAYDAVVFRESTRFRAGFAETQGFRPTMEDATAIFGQFRDRDDEDLFGVFDGHGGHEASGIVSEELPDALELALAEEKSIEDALKRSFIDVHTSLVAPDRGVQCGTTAIVMYVRGTRAYVANVGDSRCVLGNRDGSVRRVTTDHKATDPEEAARCRAKGAFVVRGRIMGMIAISRALGDAELADFLIQEPDVFSFDTTPVDLVILACDGVWDVLSDEQAMAVARSTRNPSVAAQRIRDASLAHGSRDNVSVVVIHLRDP
jgi:serine/threonine protein phosphatase PrpC